MKLAPPRPLLVSAAALLAVACLTGAKRGPIKKLAYDADAPVVELFDGIDDGTFEVRIVPHDEFSAKVYVTNTTDKPQTVQVPEAAVGVHVLKQFFQQPGGSGVGNLFGSQSGLQTGSGQDVGGSLQPSGSQSFPFSGPGNGPGFFSIPAESIVQLQFNTVCLSHGDPTPHSKMKYVLCRPADRLDSEALPKLLAGYNPRRINRQVMQAAAWHLANDMSWQQLAREQVTSIGLRPVPLLTRNQLIAARQLVTAAEEQVEDEVQPAEKRNVAQTPRESNAR